MSKKLTAKGLLREVRTLKKQASSGLNKPEPIEYSDALDLEDSINSFLSDLVDGFGFLNVTEFGVDRNTAYVDIKGRVNLEVIQSNFISQETADYLESTMRPISKYFGGSWNVHEGALGQVWNQDAALSKEWNERAYIKIAKDYIYVMPAGENIDIQAPDSVKRILGSDIYLSEDVMERYPTVKINLPKGVQKEDLPKLIMEALTDFTSKAKKFLKGLDDPKYWVQV